MLSIQSTSCCSWVEAGARCLDVKFICVQSGVRWLVGATVDLPVILSYSVAHIDLAELNGFVSTVLSGLTGCSYTKHSYLRLFEQCCLCTL